MSELKKEGEQKNHFESSTQVWLSAETENQCIEAYKDGKE